MKQNLILTSSIALLIFSASAFAEVTTTETNNGNLVMQDIPEIPASIVSSLNRYQNVRSAGFLDWTEDGNSIFVSTRFGDVSQVHRVGHPGGARQQVTFFDEPVGGVQRQPGGSKMIFTMDAGGSEFSQIFLLDWIATQPDLDKNRVAVFGGSYGGYMVLASAVHYSDRLKAAVDVVGISNFVTFLENTQDYRRDLRRAEYGDEREPAIIGLTL